MFGRRRLERPPQSQPLQRLRMALPRRVRVLTKRFVTALISFIWNAMALPAIPLQIGLLQSGKCVPVTLLLGGRVELQARTGDAVASLATV